MLSLKIPSPSPLWKYISRTIVLRGEKPKAFDAFPRVEKPPLPKVICALHVEVLSILSQRPHAWVGARCIQNNMKERISIAKIHCVANNLVAQGRLRRTSQNNNAQRKRVLWKYIQHENEIPFNCREIGKHLKNKVIALRNNQFKGECLMKQGWIVADNPFRGFMTDDQLFLCEFYEEPKRWYSTLFSYPLRIEKKPIHDVAKNAHTAMASISEGVEFVHIQKTLHSITITLCGTFHVFLVVDKHQQKDEEERSITRVLHPHSPKYNVSEKQRIETLSPKCLLIPKFENVIFTHMHASRAIGYRWFLSDTFLEGMPPLPVILPEPETVTISRQERNNNHTEKRSIVVVSRLAFEGFEDERACVNEIMAVNRLKHMNNANFRPKRKGAYAFAVMEV